MRIVCVQCGKEIYDCSVAGRATSGVVVRSEHFTPLGDYPAPQDGQPMLCPFCGGLIVVVLKDNSIVMKLSSGAYWPHPPIMEER